ncbi:MAG: hypothetical protein AB1724_16235 [Thermodesulfobacteriota bacterium]
MRKEKGRKDQRLWLIFSFLLFYVLLGYSKNLIFHLNDDVYVMLLAKSGEYHTPDTHSILGWIFKTLYSWKADFFWYDFFLVMFYIVCVSRLIFIFTADETLSFPLGALLISCIFLGFLPFQPNFTIISIFLAATALLPYFTEGVKEANAFKPKDLIISGGLFFFACLYRSPAAFLAAGCAVIIFSGLALYERIGKKKRTGRKYFLKVAAIMAGMMVFSLWMHILNIYMYKTDAGYERVIEYDAYRRGFVDYFRYSYDPSYPAYGISVNDFNLMRHFMGIDSPPLHLENLKELPKVSWFSTRRMAHGFSNTLHCFRHSCALMLVLILLGMSVVSRRARICAAVPILMIFLVGTVTCRMPLRVCLPFLSLGFLTALISIRPELQGRDRLKRNVFLYGFVAIVSILSLSVAGLYHHEKVNGYNNDLKSAERLWKFAGERHISSMAYWPLAATFDNWILFSPAPLPASIQLNRIGGWAGSYPHTIKHFQQIYGQNIYKGLAQPGTFHAVMNHPVSIPYFEAFIKEHGPDHAVPTVVFKTQRTVFYVISTAPG